MIYELNYEVYYNGNRIDNDKSRVFTRAPEALISYWNIRSKNNKSGWHYKLLDVIEIEENQVPKKAVLHNELVLYFVLD